jgi:hypothetical protein
MSVPMSAVPGMNLDDIVLGHASAAMTLDVYADLFDSDLTSVAESVAKMWPREAKTN